MTAIIWLIKSDRQRFFLNDRKKPTHSFLLIGGWQVWIFSSARPSEVPAPGPVSGSTSRPRDEAPCRDPRGSDAPAGFATRSCVVESPRVPSGIRCIGRQQVSAGELIPLVCTAAVLLLSLPGAAGLERARVCIRSSHTIYVSFMLLLDSLLLRLAENHLISLMPPPLSSLPSFTASLPTPPIYYPLSIRIPITYSNWKITLKFGQSCFLFLRPVSSYYVREGGFSFCWAKSKLGVTGLSCAQASVA